MWISWNPCPSSSRWATPSCSPSRPLGDHGAGLALGTVEHRLDRGVGDPRSELVDQRLEPALAHPGRADHRRHVAPEIPGMTHVEHDHLVHVVAQSAPVVEPQRRDAQALLPDLGREGVVGAVGGAADVALVRAVDRPEREPVAVEHRNEGRQVRDVVASPIGIVQQEHVAGMDVIAEVVADRLRRPRQGADVDGDVLGLGDEAPVGVADAGGEVAARVEDLRVRGAQHRLAHLLYDGAEPVLDHRYGNRVDHSASQPRGRSSASALPAHGPMRSSRSASECLANFGGFGGASHAASTGRSIASPRGDVGRPIARRRLSEHGLRRHRQESRCRR